MQNEPDTLLVANKAINVIDSNPMDAGKLFEVKGDKPAGCALHTF